MQNSKLLALEDAIREYVPDNASLAMGTCLEALIPFAAGHEIIRQRKKGLTLIGPISDILFDQLIGAGCVGRIRAAWVGNVITGSGYCFRRATESYALETEDHSNLTISMALKAGAMGVPFLPVRTALGSDLLKTNPSLKMIECPFTGEKLVGVSAIQPDVAIIHAQRSDVHGNAHVWGSLGITREACLASKKIIITTETIVESDQITADPNRVLTPGFRVSAVVHVPWGAHPSPVPGFYNRDHQSFLEYRSLSKTRDGFSEWRETFVDSVKNRNDYMARFKNERIERLAIKHHVLTEACDYGY